jgi:hypothetical protein
MDCLGRCGRSGARPLFQVFAIFAFLVLEWFGASCAGAQPAAASQPLNAAVSDYGTTFIFSPPPICAKCRERSVDLILFWGGLCGTLL